MTRTVLPAEEFLHPLPLGAVLLMAVNDHLLKGAGVLPGWLTGKLSDVAGLLFFPLLLTALWRTTAWLARRGRKPLSPALLAAATLLTAGCFAAIKLSPALAGLTEALVPRLDPTGFVRASRVVVDPTDLLALPVLVLTWAHGRRFFRRLHDDLDQRSKPSQKRQST